MVKVIEVSKREQVRLSERLAELSAQIKEVARNVGEWDDQEVRDELETIAGMVRQAGVPMYPVRSIPPDDVRFIQ